MQLNLNHFKHIVTLCELDSKGFSNLSSDSSHPSHHFVTSLFVCLFVSFKTFRLSARSNLNASILNWPIVCFAFWSHVLMFYLMFVPAHKLGLYDQFHRALLGLRSGLPSSGAVIVRDRSHRVVFICQHQSDNFFGIEFWFCGAVHHCSVEQVGRGQRHTRWDRVVKLAPWRDFVSC